MSKRTVKSTLRIGLTKNSLERSCHIRLYLSLKTDQYFINSNKQIQELTKLLIRLSYPRYLLLVIDNEIVPKA